MSFLIHTDLWITGAVWIKIVFGTTQYGPRTLLAASFRVCAHYGNNRSETNRIRISMKFNTLLFLIKITQKYSFVEELEICGYYFTRNLFVRFFNSVFLIFSIYIQIIFGGTTRTLTLLIIIGDNRFGKINVYCKCI